ncbi:MAG: flagellar basal body P-ring formation protein FlgA [Candidatus Brocadia sp.]|nr:MAG: flagellar basal body P-ring formation protein FlgA [Candidatus Brocadia sp.]
MKLKGLILLPATIFFIVHTTVAEIIKIDLREKVILPEKQIVLSDIASISCNNPLLLERVGNVFLGNTPWPGNVRKIERDLLAVRLMDEGIDVNEVTYGSTTVSLVSAESTTITGSEILMAAKEYLLSNLSRSEDEIIIETDRMIQDKLLPASKEDVRLEVTQVETNKDRGNVQLIVRILTNDKLCMKVPVFFNIRLYENIVTSSKKIDRNDTLTLDNLIISRMETTKLSRTVFSKVEELVGKRALRSILPNTPITPELVDNSPAIKKGDLIKVFIHTGNLHVVTKGVAKEDGCVGKIIRVKNIDSNKDLYGKVEDSTAVKIVF